MNYGAKMDPRPFIYLFIYLFIYFDNSIVRRGDLIPKHHVENAKGANKPTKLLSRNNMM